MSQSCFQFFSSELTTFLLLSVGRCNLVTITRRRDGYPSLFSLSLDRPSFGSLPFGLFIACRKRQLSSLCWRAWRKCVRNDHPTSGRFAHQCTHSAMRIQSRFEFQRIPGRHRSVYLKKQLCSASSSKLQPDWNKLIARIVVSGQSTNTILPWERISSIEISSSRPQKPSGILPSRDSS